MGQKVHPYGMRLGYIRTWKSLWWAKKDYARLLHQDLKIRRLVKTKLFHAGISNTEIERTANQLKVTIHTARPGIIIGRKGVEVDKFKAEIEGFTQQKVYIDIKEVKRPEIDAQLVAESVAMQLEKRIAFRRAMKKAIASAMRLGAKGIKIQCAGRLGGAEIARTEWYREGSVPLHTLRADIDFAIGYAATSMGQIGVKVWIHHGEMLPNQMVERGAVAAGYDRPGF